MIFLPGNGCTLLTPLTFLFPLTKLTYAITNFKVVSPSLSSSPLASFRGVLGFSLIEPPLADLTIVPFTD